MRVRVGVVAATAVMALVASVPASVSPAAGATFDRWRYELRPAGFPVVDDPALTIESASARHALGFPDDIRATVTLAGVPDASTDSVVQLVFGDEVDGECVPRWEVAVSTLQPAAPATRNGRSIALAGPAGGRSDSWTCSILTLADADDPSVVLDRLDGEPFGKLFEDYITSLRLHSVPGQRVRPHRWTTVRVELHNTSTGIAIDRVEIVGQRSDDVRVRDFMEQRDLGPADRLVVRLSVLLRADAARRLHLRAKPTSYYAMNRAVSKTIWIRPR